ncbi:hypothetical protein, partial [Paraburkholderia nemoris]|uniref:hypothetical protein n=1 Tax=Paraburkholderia nemoris TaxID=2793076 RepID=UPI001B8B3559
MRYSGKTRPGYQSEAGNVDMNSHHEHPRVAGSAGARPHAPPEFRFWRRRLARRVGAFATVSAAVMLAASAWVWRDGLVPATLSVRPGQTWEEVVKGSTFPVAKHSDMRNNGSGTTDVDASAVVIVFNDPINGFTLPATRSAKITWRNARVAAITASPM